MTEQIFYTSIFIMNGGPEKDRLFFVFSICFVIYARSPRIRRANCISFGIIVTRFA